ncbi:hypothetical protein V6N11_028993 [Hibiscus sabdariffa]|uniref:Uncharacterized protein n=2 Tax=Hibiscus sabdariffa TaxID=183260 RepID=A0ABR2BS47_9ROSI
MSPPHLCLSFQGYEKHTHPLGLKSQELRDASTRFTFDSTKGWDTSLQGYEMLLHPHGRKSQENGDAFTQFMSASPRVFRCINLIYCHLFKGMRCLRTP